MHRHWYFLFAHSGEHPPEGGPSTPIFQYAHLRARLRDRPKNARSKRGLPACRDLVFRAAISRGSVRRRRPPGWLKWAPIRRSTRGGPEQASPQPRTGVPMSLRELRTTLDPRGMRRCRRRTSKPSRARQGPLRSARRDSRGHSAHSRIRESPLEYRHFQYPYKPSHVCKALIRLGGTCAAGYVAGSLHTQTH